MYVHVCICTCWGIHCTLLHCLLLMVTCCMHKQCIFYLACVLHWVHALWVRQHSTMLEALWPRPWNSPARDNPHSWCIAQIHSRASFPCMNTHNNIMCMHLCGHKWTQITHTLKCPVIESEVRIIRLVLATTSVVITSCVKYMSIYSHVSITHTYMYFTPE